MRTDSTGINDWEKALIVAEIRGIIEHINKIERSDE